LTIDGEGRGIVRQDLGNCRGKLSWGQVRPFSNLLCTCPPIGMIKYKRIHAMKSLINNEIANKLHTPKHTVCGWKWKGGRKVGGGGCDGLPAAWLAALYDLRCSFIHLALGGTESLPVGPAHIADDGCLAVGSARNFHWLTVECFRTG